MRRGLHFPRFKSVVIIMRAQKRIQRELERFHDDGDDSFRVQIVSPMQWKISFTGPPPLYTGEAFSLRFTFNEEYPMDSPEVIFEPPKVPMHPHIYSNGHICLNILGD